MNKTLEALQAEYNAMVKIAYESLDADLELDPQFEKELSALAKLVKGMGGKA